MGAVAGSGPRSVAAAPSVAAGDHELDMATVVFVTAVGVVLKLFDLLPAIAYLYRLHKNIPRTIQFPATRFTRTPNFYEQQDSDKRR